MGKTFIDLQLNEQKVRYSDELNDNITFREDIINRLLDEELITDEEAYILSQTVFIVIESDAEDMFSKISLN